MATSNGASHFEEISLETFQAVRFQQFVVRYLASRFVYPDESNHAITCTTHTKSYVMYIDAKSLREEDAYSIIYNL